MEWIEVNIPKEMLSVADICEYMDVSTFVVTSVLRSGRQVWSRMASVPTRLRDVDQ